MRNVSLLLGLLLAALASPAAALDLASLSSYAFIASRASPQIAVLDMRSSTVVARIALQQPAYQLAISPERAELIAGSLADSRVTVIDLGTLREKRALTLDHEPEHIQLGPGGDVLAVGNYYADALTLIDLDDMAIRRVHGLSSPHNVLFAPDGKQLYVANLGSDQVSVVDTASGELRPGMAVMREPGNDPGITSLMLSRDGRRVWAIPGTGAELAVLDAGSGKPLRQDRVGPQPWRVAMTSDEQLMITANTGDRSLSLVDMAHGAELARLKGAETMEAILPAWFDTTGFVLSKSDKALLVIDLDKRQMALPIALPGTPEAAVSSPDGSEVIVALSEPGGIAVVDAREKRVAKVIGGVLADPFRIATVGSRNICE